MANPVIETEETQQLSSSRRATGRYVLGALAVLYVIGVLYCFVTAVSGSGKPDVPVMSSAFWHPSAPE